MTRLSLILAAVILLTVPLSAQRRDRDCDREDRDQRRQQNTELRAEMHEWITTEVLPQVRQWQQDFDATLSSTELATLRDLRTKAAELRDQIRSEMQDMRPSADRSDKRARRSEMRELRKRHRDDMRAILDELEPIATAHKDDLRAMFDAHEDQIDVWRDELREKMEDAGAGKGRHAPGLDEMKMLMGRGRDMAARFLLWNGEIPPQPPAPKGPMGMGRRDQVLPPVTVAPNPSENTARVQMDGIPDGNSTIEVFDMNGNLVRSQKVTVTSKRLDETISIDGLAPGTYMVSVNTPNGRRTETLVVTN